MCCCEEATIGTPGSIEVCQNSHWPYWGQDVTLKVARLTCVLFLLDHNAVRSRQ